MKKIIYIFCILVLTLNLISCGNKETVDSDEQATEQKESTNTIKAKSEELHLQQMIIMLKQNGYMVQKKRVSDNII